MARNVQLLELLAKLRAETGRTQKVSFDLDGAENLKAILRRTQESLYDEYSWSHLQIDATVDLQEGQRYYDLPSNLNFDRIIASKVKYNNAYIDFERGIKLSDYTSYDSNLGAKANPARKWEIKHTGSKEQLEVWPIPADDNQMVYFEGIKKLNPLVADTDRAELDDILIVLFAAAEILARQKSSDAQAKLELAQKRLATLRKNSQAASPPVQMGLGNRFSSRNNRPIIIAGS